MAVKRRRLTDANVARLAPAAREYTIWDTHHAGLGVRVRPSDTAATSIAGRGTARAGSPSGRRR